MVIEPDLDLIWYFHDSASELGLHAISLSECIQEPARQRFPTAKMCRAAARQRAIREALRQLSPKLQAVLECAYQVQGLTTQRRAEHDLAAHLVARVKARGVLGQRELLVMVSALHSAHVAFRIAYGSSTDRSRQSRVHSQVQRWLAEDGLCA